jgi:hypothetical protein
MQAPHGPFDDMVRSHTRCSSMRSGSDIVIATKCQLGIDDIWWGTTNLIGFNERIVSKFRNSS